MKKALEATQQHFESSTGRTPKYLAWHRLFKREFSLMLKQLGAEAIEIGKPNHFDMSGFFQVRGQWWWVNIGDLRWNKDRMLIRTAKHNRDYTGGGNQYIPLTVNAADFNDRLVEITGFEVVV